MPGRIAQDRVLEHFYGENTMILPFRKLLFALAILTGFITSVSVFAEEVFDRLDGKGPSGKRVDVIEWEGNLEIHVYPKGSLQGLGAKLDDREKGKKVMVIGYRLGKKDRPLVRRAILGIPFQRTLKGFIDSSAKGYDKLALSNQTLSGTWKPYRLDPPPAQWYPDGDERNEEEPAPVRGPASRAEKPAKIAPREEGSLNQFDF
jgi:hypothetical protein